MGVNHDLPPMKIELEGLKIMSGMITTGDTNISDYGSRTVEIEVTGVCRQDVMRTSNYKVRVPYSRMSQTMQNINRMGGKVAKVSLLPGASTNTEGTNTEATTAVEQPVKHSNGKKNRNRKQ
jgi:phycocyanin-associated, rod